MKLGTVLAVLAVVGLVGIAWAADAPATRPARPLAGQVVSVAAAGNVVVKTMARRGGEGKEVTVATNDKTVVTIDEKAATVADLKKDMYVRITPAEGVAEKIVATTKAPERPTRPATPPAKAE